MGPRNTRNPMSTQLHSNTTANSTSTQTASFIVGQDREGHWLAVETHGFGGGIFRTRDSAYRYARDECHRRPGAVRLVDEPISLMIS